MAREHIRPENGRQLLNRVILALAASPAIAAKAYKFKAVINSFTYVGSHAGYNVFDETGTGTVVGDFTAQAGAHFTHNSTQVQVWTTITAQNGDLLYLNIEQTGSVASGSFTGPYTIAGGTGRFANARGIGTCVVFCDTTTGAPLRGSFDGTISF